MLVRIHTIIGDLPTYGYRRVWALLHRQSEYDDMVVINAKHVYRIMRQNALLMAVRRRKPEENVIVHSDQGSQYGSDDWQRFCRANNLVPSMSRRGNCWDNSNTQGMLGVKYSW
ncbi:hypothetical protein GM30_05105 [Trabulsiella odontotermitis]|nr:hypothetical protein GM30_05105 [Trabulsiella odontotermitis]